MYRLQVNKTENNETVSGEGRGSELICQRVRLTRGGYFTGGGVFGDGMRWNSAHVSLCMTLSVCLSVDSKCRS